MANMEHANAVTIMQEYIEEHLEEDITLQSLANAAGYSPWYCARIFKEYTETSPFEYIRKRRLSTAALKLWNKDEKVE